LRELFCAAFVTTLLLAGSACDGDGDANGPAATEEREAATATLEDESPTPRQNATEEDPAGTRYDNSMYGYSLTYPEDWDQIQQDVTTQAETGDNAVDTQAFGELNETTSELNGLGVTIRQLNLEVTEDLRDEAYAELDVAFQDLALQLDGEMVETGDAELGGLPARRYVMDFLYSGEVPTRSEYIIVFLGDLEYEVNCQAEEPRFEEVRAGCRQIWDSFEISGA
jgi:hypothetical protein